MLHYLSNNFLLKYVTFIYTFSYVSMINQTYTMIIFNYFYNKIHFGNLVFFDLNIIFNLSHPSKHSQNLTNFTLNPPTFTFNPHKVNNTNFTL